MSEAKNIEVFNSPLPVAPPINIMDVISRAAADPATDVGKLERLLEMYERITAQQAKTAFKAAQVEMKPKLPVIDKNGKIVIKKKDSEIVVQSTPYALYEDLDAAITPILHEHGFVISFRPGTAPDGKITVTAILSHKLGHEEEATVPLPHDGSGSKNAVQAVGSSLSYGKRYAATMLLNLRTKGEDDDGKAGGVAATISAEQTQTIGDMIERGKADVEAFCKYMGVAAIVDIPRKDYERAVTALNLKLAKKAPK